MWAFLLILHSFRLFIDCTPKCTLNVTFRQLTQDCSSSLRHLLAFNFCILYICNFETKFEIEIIIYSVLLSYCPCHSIPFMDFNYLKSKLRLNKEKILTVKMILLWQWQKPSVSPAIYTLHKKKIKKLKKKKFRTETIYIFVPASGTRMSFMMVSKTMGEKMCLLKRTPFRFGSFQLMNFSGEQIDVKLPSVCMRCWIPG